ncbi:hypothetical protein [Schaalia sp. Marseille-Q2122]|uniref:hypothetical protein n=1 Tax=Schaalia sp. Marseille-Q2122 TaxID=2736604 RepID=UPI00158D4AE9|nr:hypothetical protein [Schaalia sp. Marseille-Q2122]
MNTTIPQLHSPPRERARVAVILVLSFLLFIASFLALVALFINTKHPLETVRVYDRAQILDGDSLYRSLKAHVLDEDLAVIVVSVDSGHGVRPDAELWSFLQSNPHVDRWLVPGAKEGPASPFLPDPRLRGRVIVMAMSADNEMWAAVSPDLCSDEATCDALFAAVYWNSQAQTPSDALEAVVSRQIDRLDSGLYPHLLGFFFAMFVAVVAAFVIVEIDSVGVRNRKSLAWILTQYRELESQALERFREVERILAADMHALDALTHYQRYVDSIEAWETSMASYLPLGFLESCTPTAEKSIGRFESALEGLRTLSAEREGIADLITGNAAGAQRWKTHVERVHESIRHYGLLWMRAYEAPSGSALSAGDVTSETFKSQLSAITWDYREGRIDIVEAFRRLAALRRDLKRQAWKIAVRHCAQEILLIEEGTLNVEAQLYEKVRAQLEEEFHRDLLDVDWRSLPDVSGREEEYFLAVARKRKADAGEEDEDDTEAFLGSMGALRCVYEQRLKMLNIENVRQE